jgi:hypothetical protein
MGAFSSENAPFFADKYSIYYLCRVLIKRIFEIMKYSEIEKKIKNRRLLLGL